MRKISKNRNKKICFSWAQYNGKMWLNCVTQIVHKLYIQGFKPCKIEKNNPSYFLSEQVK